MFKDDKMMTLLTGLVLAIFAGTMVQYGDSIISLLSGQTTESTEDDYFTALAGAEQQLDVLANDAVRGPLAVTTVPACGELRPGIAAMPAVWVNRPSPIAWQQPKVAPINP